MVSGTRSTALGGIEIRGLDQIERALDPHIFRYAGAIVLRRALYRTRSEAREIVPGRIFDNSINVKVLPDRINGIVYSNAETALSVHEGRRPGEQVSIRKLKMYIKRYGLAGSVSVKTRRALKPGKSAKAIQAQDAAAISLAYRLRHRIAEQGTKPIEYLTRPLAATSRDLERYWREAVPKAIAHFAKGAR